MPVLSWALCVCIICRCVEWISIFWVVFVCVCVSHHAFIPSSSCFIFKCLGLVRDFEQYQEAKTHSASKKFSACAMHMRRIVLVCPLLRARLIIHRPRWRCGCRAGLIFHVLVCVCVFSPCTHTQQHITHNMQIITDTSSCSK